MLGAFRIFDAAKEGTDSCPTSQSPHLQLSYVFGDSETAKIFSSRCSHGMNIISRISEPIAGTLSLMLVLLLSPLFQRR